MDVPIKFKNCSRLLQFFFIGFSQMTGVGGVAPRFYSGQASL